MRIILRTVPINNCSSTDKYFVFKTSYYNASGTALYIFDRDSEILYKISTLSQGEVFYSVISTDQVYFSLGANPYVYKLDLEWKKITRYCCEGDGNNQLHRTEDKKIWFSTEGELYVLE